MPSRRDALVGLGSLTAILALPTAVVWTRAAQSKRGTDPLLDRLCDLVIPATDTPGAVAAGVPAFVLVALEHGLRKSTPQLREEFVRALDARAGTAFVDLDPDRALELLGAVDAAAFAARDSAPTQTDDAVRHWPTLKALIVMGYYTSEIGASQELVYELVPGTLEPDVPLESQPRAYSSDWTGVKFG